MVTTKLTTAQRKVALQRLMDKNQSSNAGSYNQPMGNNAFPQQGLGMEQIPDQSQYVPEPPPLGDIQAGIDPEAPVEDYNDDNTELTAVEEQAQYALIADQLWKDSASEGSIAEQVWNGYRKDSGDKSFDSARDYFISSFVKYKLNPVNFTRNKPKEARLIRQLSDEYDASVSGGNGIGFFARR
jgi:hypothetical protein